MFPSAHRGNGKEGGDALLLRLHLEELEELEITALFQTRSSAGRYGGQTSNDGAAHVGGSRLSNAVAMNHFLFVPKGARHICVIVCIDHLKEFEE